MFKKVLTVVSGLLILAGSAYAADTTYRDTNGHPVSTSAATPLPVQPGDGTNQQSFNTNGAAAVTMGVLDPLGCQQWSGANLNAAVGLASLGTGIPTGATIVSIQAEDQNIRWRDDGTSPTASVGMRLFVGETITYSGDLTAIELIEEANDAKGNACYYK